MRRTAEIVALPTKYGGHVFRSRAEARWAVFFDFLAIPYRYEAEGFDTPAGPYLPDFLLPTLQLVYEVKGVKPDELAEDKAKHVGNHLGWRAVVSGTVDAHYDAALARRVVEWQDGPAVLCAPYWDNRFAWCECPCCGYTDMQFEGRAGRIACCAKNVARNADDDPNIDTKRLLAAYIRAMTLRFVR